jgi:hypothetical protein
MPANRSRRISAMPTRPCLCLLIACLSTGAAAREVKHSSPNSGACAESPTGAETVQDKPHAGRATAPARGSGPRPTLHGNAPARPALRWHSFLPGMFR